jgi:MFS family permease
MTGAHAHAAVSRPSRLAGPWAIVVAVGVGVFVGGFDQTFIVPVLSSVLDDFDVPVDEFGQASWVINGYLLGYTVAMPAMGRIADVYGHIRVFVVALIVFMGGSVLVALSPDLPLMSGARALTAIGGGALVPIALSVAAGNLSGRQRPLGLSAISTLDDASSLLGPLWGTIIGVWLGWRGLFWMNLALGAPVLIAVVLLARRNGIREERVVGARVDWPGAVLSTGALTTLTFALADAGSRPRPVEQTAALYAAAVALFAAFILWERRAPSPLIDLGMFRNPRVAATFALFLFEGGALITALVNVPLGAEALWGEEDAGPGLVLMRMVLFMIVGGFAGALLLGWIGQRATVALGMAGAAGGLAWMGWWPEVPGEAAAWGALAVAGVGFTLSDAGLYLSIVEGVDASRRVSAVALLQVAQTTGMIVGMALLATQGLGRFDRRAADLFAGDPAGATEEQYRAIIERSIDETYFAAAAVMVVATVVAVVFLRDRRSRPTLLRGAGLATDDAPG